MRAFSRLLLAGCMAVPGISVSFADVTFTSIQFSHDFGSQSIMRVRLGLIEKYADDQHDLGLWVPLYSTNPADMRLWPMNAARRDAPLCERSPASCLAFGLILGAGIVYFATEVAEQDDDRITIGFSSGSTSIGVTSSHRSKQETR